MKCKSCNDKPMARGVKLIECITCGNSRAVYVDAKAGICNACSEKYVQCVMCGNVFI